MIFLGHQKRGISIARRGENTQPFDEYKKEKKKKKEFLNARKTDKKDHRK